MQTGAIPPSDMALAPPCGKVIVLINCIFDVLTHEDKAQQSIAEDPTRVSFCFTYLFFESILR